MVIVALEHVPHCYTQEDGMVINRLLSQAMSAEEQVTLSFTGVTDVPSSFVNAGLVALLERYEYREITARLKIIDAPRAVIDVVRRCFANALGRPKAA